MKDKNTRLWIPLYIDKWIFGSTRIELEPAERGVFIDLLALGAKDDGYIRANETTAYLHMQLAGLLNIPVELLESTIAKCLHFDKLLEPKPGIYKLSNWDVYQFSRQYIHEVNVKGTPSLQNCKAGLQNCKADLTDCKAIRKDRIGKDKRGEGGGEAAPPTLSEVRDYREAEHLRADPEKFHAWQAAKGWAGIIDWRAAFRYWDKTEYPDKAAPVPPVVRKPWVDPLADIGRKNAFHDKHMAGGKCSFCGKEYPSLDVCACDKYTAAFKKHMNATPAIPSNAKGATQ